MFAPKPLSALANKILPHGILTKLKAAYANYHRGEVARLNRRLMDALVSSQPGRVQSGPFKGMVYGDSRREYNLVSKWLGAYELELHDAVDKLCRRLPRFVVNIGCAEGYYAVGFALRLSEARIVAFDLDPNVAEACRDLARLNNVQDRIEVRGCCTIESLRELVGESTLVVCDCEGAEMALLNPEGVPGLIRADLLVELHDFANPAISATLLKRFGSSHEIEIIGTTERHPSDFPQLAALSPRDRILALEEFRPGRMEWAVMTPRSD